MRTYPKPVLQEFMTDFYGGGSTTTISTMIITEISECSESSQKAIVDKILHKYFNISDKELTELLALHHPEKLI